MIFRRKTPADFERLSLWCEQFQHERPILYWLTALCIAVFIVAFAALLIDVVKRLQ